MKILLITLLTLLIGINCFSENKNTRSAIRDNEIPKVRPLSQNIVYVCTGSYSYAYHSKSNCRGLNNCQGNIVYTSQSDAANRGYKPCEICWGAYYNSSNYYSDPDLVAGYAYATAIIGGIFLANDIYIYPSYTFTKCVDETGNSIDKKDAIGIVFGFRKNWKRCGLEWGGSYKSTFIKESAEWYGIYEEYYIKYKRLNEWGVHLNFIHNLFNDKMPQWFKIYVGAGFDYDCDTKIGGSGIGGFYFKLCDRLRLDTRYQYGNMMNGLQIGLGFTFQKKYLWQK